MSLYNSLRLLLFFVMLLGMTFTCMAQSELKHEADSLFAAGEFERVELLLLRLNGGHADLTDSEFAEVKVTTGFAMIMLGREADARKYFTEALELNPDLTLDPVMISPKFRVVFDDVKAGLQKDKPEDVRPVYRGASPESHLLNLVLPGAGQIREGYWRGAVFLAAQTASVVLLIDQLDKTSDSRAYYLAQTERSAIASAYDDYNRDNKTAWEYGILSGIVYLAAQADLAFINKPLNSDDRLSFVILPAGNQLFFQVRW